eukprot:Filipodium_phascolosomae@DN1576_c0_g1_i1.p2
MVQHYNVAVEVLDLRKQSAMYFAASSGAVDAMDALALHGALCDGKDHLRQSPLFFAAANGHISAVKWLLDNGADAARTDTTTARKRADWFARRGGHDEVVELLRSSLGVKGVNIDSGGSGKRRAPIESQRSKPAKVKSPSARRSHKKKWSAYKLFKLDSNSVEQPVTEYDIQEFEKSYPEVVQWNNDSPLLTYDFWELSEYRIWQPAAFGIMKRLWKMEVASAFRYPVAEDELVAPNYFVLIKHPMDLHTVKCKLTSHQYTSFAEFNSDLELIFHNCFLYNSKPDHPIRLAGERLQSLTREIIRETIKTTIVPPNNPNLFAIEIQKT